jgi:exodeoxyribonuclease VII small subunit
MVASPAFHPATVPASETAAPDFERMLKELEALVARLEQGELPLEESLRQFERGVELTRLCEQALKAAEQKVEILLEQQPGARPVPFEAPAG